MKNRMFLSFFITLLTLSSVANAQIFSGNNNITREQRKVVPFSAIALTGNMDVFITQGDACSVEVETDSNFQEFITADVRNNVLRVNAKNRVYTRLTIYITMIDIVYVDADRAHLRITENYNSDRLLVNVTNGGTLQIDNSFSVNDFTVNLYSSSSAAGAYNMNIGNKLQLSATGGSKMDFIVTASLVDVEALSTAQVKLAGKANQMTAIAKGVSKISASELILSDASLIAKSASQINACVTNKVTSNYTSGSTINVSGNPSSVTER